MIFPLGLPGKPDTLGAEKQMASVLFMRPFYTELGDHPKL